MIISDLLKRSYHRGFLPHFYFWRDQVGHEVDCIIDQGTNLLPVEIKSGKTINFSYFDGLKYWDRLADVDTSKGCIVYGGEKEQVRSDGTALGWADVDQIDF